MWFFKRQLCPVEDEDSHLPPSALCLGHRLLEALLDQSAGFSETQTMRVLIFFVFFFSHGVNGTKQRSLSATCSINKLLIF